MITRYKRHADVPAVAGPGDQDDLTLRLARLLGKVQPVATPPAEPFATACARVLDVALTIQAGPERWAALDEIEATGRRLMKMQRAARAWTARELVIALGSDEAARALGLHPGYVRRVAGPATSRAPRSAAGRAREAVYFYAVDGMTLTGAARKAGCSWRSVKAAVLAAGYTLRDPRARRTPANPPTPPPGR